MSVINTMLQDLEARHALKDGDKTLLEDLPKAATPDHRRASLSWRIGAPILLFACLALLYQQGKQHQQVQLSQPVIAALALPPMSVAAYIKTPQAIEPAEPVQAAPETKAPAVTPTPIKPTVPQTIQAEPPSKPAQEAPAPRMERKTRELNPRQWAEQQYAQTLPLLKRRRLDEAQERLEGILQRYPQHNRARAMLARLLIDQNRLQPAQTLLRNGLALTADHQLAHLLARLQVQNGEKSQALETLDKYRPTAARDPGYYATEAALLQREGLHQAAAQRYRSALAQRPRTGSWWVGLAISEEALQRYDGAVEAYRQAVRDPALDETMQGYAKTRINGLMRSGRLEGASP